MVLVLVIQGPAALALTCNDHASHKRDQQADAARDECHGASNMMSLHDMQMADASQTVAVMIMAGQPTMGQATGPDTCCDDGCACAVIGSMLKTADATLATLATMPLLAAGEASWLNIQRMLATPPPIQ